MLCLSRKINEAIVIGDNVRITVIDIRRDKVRLAVDADPQTPVHRQEVFDHIKAREAQHEADRRSE